MNQDFVNLIRLVVVERPQLWSCILLIQILVLENNKVKEGGNIEWWGRKMESNRFEATVAKEIAERKFTAQDIAGAKKFALKAQNLYPNLDGISNMLSTFDVYLSAKNKVCGEADWYGILGVSQYSDDETVRKQYKKLALLLHPDKNQSVGADGAFKLISEAWSLLSDRTKRAAYDQMRFPRTSHPEVSTTASGPSSTDANVFRQYQGAKKKTNNDLYYDIAGWVVLAVAIVAWIGMAKSQVPL